MDVEKNKLENFFKKIDNKEKIKVLGDFGLIISESKMLHLFCNKNLKLIEGFTEEIELISQIKKIFKKIEQKDHLELFQLVTSLFIDFYYSFDEFKNNAQSVEEKLEIEKTQNKCKDFVIERLLA